MKNSQFTKILFLILLDLVLIPNVFAQSDGEKFAEGRLAMDKFNDCPAAVKVLESVSEAGRQNPLWIFYMAKANECVGNLKDALTYYEKYNLLIPGQGEVVDKIGELRYKAKKQQEQEQAELKEFELSLQRAKDFDWMNGQTYRPNVSGTIIPGICRSGYYAGETVLYTGCVIATENGIDILDGKESKYDVLVSATTNTGKWERFDEKKKDKLLRVAVKVGERKGKPTYLCNSTGWFDEDNLTCFTTELRDDWRDWKDYPKGKYNINKNKNFSILIP